jgi:hypothetical protein
VLVSYRAKRLFLLPVLSLRRRRYHGDAIVFKGIIGDASVV